MRATQGVASQSILAGPFNPAPLQQLIGLKVQEFVQGIVRRGLQTIRPEKIEIC